MFLSFILLVPSTSLRSPQPLIPKKKIMSVYRPEQDQIGAYFGGWQEVTDRAGVRFRSTPTFWGAKISQCEQNCGFSVPLNSYSTGELDRIFETSLALLKSSGLPLNNEIFSVAGWVHSPAIEKIAARHQLKYSFSSIAPSKIKDSMQDFPIYAWVKTSGLSLNLSTSLARH